MLPKSHRLTHTRDFTRTRRFGRSAASPLVALYVIPNRPPSLRIGFSVSKRVGNAVIRNRVKRLMREAVRHNLPAIRGGQDLVFIARPAAATASFTDLQEVAALLLKKTGAVR